MPDQSTTAEFDIHRVLRVLRRRRLVIAALIVVVPLAALGYSLNQPTEYSASATLLLQNPNLPQQVGGSLTLQLGEDPSRVAATAIQLAQSATVANMTEATLHAPLGSVSVQGNASTDLISIVATETKPTFAAAVANTYAREYETFARQQEAATILSVRQQFERQYAALSAAARRSAEGQSLLNTANHLEQLASLQTGDAELVQPATAPVGPSGPRTVRNVLLGLAVGVLLGLALAFLFDMVDRRVREPSELEEIFGRPVLATVPELKELKAGKRTAMLSGHAQEVFQLLRANLRYFNVDRDMKTVLVTSALPGEGKTTVAWNLAVTAARSRSRVLLIEADLRRPTLANRQSAPSAAGGLSTVLSDQQSMDQAVQHLELTGGRGQADQRTGSSTLDVLFAGPIPPNPADLLESRRMGTVLQEARSLYDLVVIDTPPAAVVSDAAPLVGQVDGVIVVSRLRKLKRESAAHLRKQLDRFSAPVIGIVVNSLYKSDAYGYGGYDYYSSGARQYLSALPDDRSDNAALLAASNGRTSDTVDVSRTEHEDPV